MNACTTGCELFNSRVPVNAAIAHGTCRNLCLVDVFGRTSTHTAYYCWSRMPHKVGFAQKVGLEPHTHRMKYVIPKSCHMPEIDLRDYFQRGDARMVLADCSVQMYKPRQNRDVMPVHIRNLHTMWSIGSGSGMFCGDVCALCNKITASPARTCFLCMTTAHPECSRRFSGRAFQKHLTQTRSLPQLVAGAVPDGFHVCMFCHVCVGHPAVFGDAVEPTQFA